MNSKVLMFAGWVLIGGYFISQIMEGAYFTVDDLTVFNSLMAFRIVTFLNFVPIPLPNPDFFLVGIPKLLSWDFAFFGGEAGIIKYLFYALSIGITWGIAVSFIGLTTFWRR